MSSFFKVSTVIGLALCLTAQISQAQVSSDALGYYNDVARFSQTSLGGSARMQGIAGAQTALGADISGIAVNPAGLGLFNRNKLSFSPALQFANTSTTYNSATDNTTLDASKGNVNVNNFGIVFSNIDPHQEKTSDVLGGAFGISFQRVNNFQNRTSYRGNNGINSYRNGLIERMNGNHFDTYNNQFADFNGLISLEALAYFSYLINDEADNGQPTRYSTFDDGEPVEQSESINEKGAQYQWDFGYGINYSDKLYFGASIGYVRSRYSLERLYKENLLSQPDSLLSWNYQENYSVKAHGINFKIGMIARPQDWVRIGLSLQTPTAHTVSEEINYRHQATFNNITLPGGIFLSTEQYETLDLVYDYNMITPARANFGIAMLSGDVGFLSADVEYVGYKGSSVSNKSKNEFDNAGVFDGDNETIQNAFRGAANVRLGGELKSDIFRFRAGFARYGDLYKNVDDINRSKTYITGGLGVQLDNSNIDLAVVHQRFKSAYTPYTTSDGFNPTTESVNKNLNFVLTWSTTFN